MDVEQLRKDYLPEKIKVLFIAEAKPEADERFFYFDDVTDKDFLYIYLMRALYDKDDVQWLRANKLQMLDTFKNDGYYLIDAVDEPTAKADLKKAIKANADNKVAEVESLISQRGDADTKIVIIKATVFDVLYDRLKDKFNVVNDSKIYFPSTGREPEFLKQMSEIVEELL